MNKKLIGILFVTLLIVCVFSGSAKIINIKENAPHQKTKNEIMVSQSSNFRKKELQINTIVSPQYIVNSLTQQYRKDINWMDYNQLLKGIFKISNVYPMASFEWAPPKPKVNELVTFNASFSYNPDGTIVDYSWDWDSDDIYDESVIAPTVTHSWSHSGDYPVTLKITDNQGLSDTVTRTVYVVDEWDIIVPDDYVTFQDAIDNSNRGDRVFVRAGTYNEDIVIDVEMLILHGENKDNTIIVGTGNDNVIRVADNANNVNISGFTVSGSREDLSGIFMESDYNIIADNNIIDNNGIGVESFGSSGNQILDNTITDNLWGIGIFSDSHGVSLQGNIINRNSGHGVFIDDTSTGNTVHNSTISDNGDCGIFIMDVSKGNSVTWNTIEGNNFGVKCDSISDGNLYHHNSLIDNGVNAFDGSTNSWNSILAGSDGMQLLQGNYWSDYDGVDEDGDGIGDTPYIVPGGDNKDYYPFMTSPSIHRYDVAGLYMYFSSMEGDHNRSYELPELVEGDHVWFTTWWDVIPDHYMTEWEYYNVEYEYWLDGEKYDHWLGWEHQVDPYEWRPDIFVPAFYEWQHEYWNATPGYHNFRAIFDPFDTWEETNEGNNEIIVDFYVAEAKDMVARFNWDPEQPEINELVIFNASESFTPHGEIIKYEWDWDNDGVFDESHSIPTVEHFWYNSGSYPVTLNVINSNGVNDSIIRTVVVVNKRVIFVPDEYNSIQEAIDDADEGIIIHVAAGNYNENLIINKSVRIFGEDKEVTIIDGEGVENHIVCIEADNVEIAGFTIMNCDVAFSGIRIYGDRSIIHDNTIINCGGSIELYWTNDSYIGNNEIIDNLWGIFISGSSNSEIEFNHFEENDYGIEIGLSNAFIIYNVFENNNKHGIFLVQTSPLIIDSNNFYNNKGTGIKMFSSSYTNIFDNVIKGNNIDGISLHKSSKNNIYRNSIVDNGDYPISFWYYSDENRIVKNEIESRGSWGVHFEYSSDNIVDKNTFINNDTTSDNDIGMCLIRSSNNNMIYHNNFIDDINTFDECGNTWDNGRLFGGNYWEDYQGTDSNYDGIGDIPNSIQGGGCQDHYPFIYFWNPPGKPITPTGSTQGKVRKEYAYQTASNDLEDDRIQYGWDWNGDKTVDEWTDYYNSGETVTTYHKWNKKDAYNLFVVARDEKGQISDWSDPLPISMIKNKVINSPFLQFLENHPHLFSLLQQLLRLQ